MGRKPSSLDVDYRSGGLSNFPHSLDNKYTLFEAGNNVETTLRHSLTPGGKHIVVDDASKFPNSGIVRISTPDEGGEKEAIHYGKKVGNQLHDLHRGYAGFSIYHWQAGSKVAMPVMAEHHNALKDAVMRLQGKVGLAIGDDSKTLSGMVRLLEQKWLSPKVMFRAFPTTGAPGVNVRFQNFSSGYGVRFFWDFGDGNTSTEKNPSHVYDHEGSYGVTLNMIASTGAKGVSQKNDFITVAAQTDEPFFYTTPLQGYSKETAAKNGVEPTIFTMVDQTTGKIAERSWFFTASEELTTANPDIHVAKHVFEKPGTYTPSLLIRMEDGKIARALTVDGIMVF